jgi:hypothetical protein
LGWETTLLYLIMPVILVIGQSLTMKVLSPGPQFRKVRNQFLDCQTSNRTPHTKYY